MGALIVSNYECQAIVEYLSLSANEITPSNGLGLIIECYMTVLQLFKNDVDKTNAWLYAENPLLGYVTPRSMIAAGKSKKLLKFIKDALDESKRPHYISREDIDKSVFDISTFLKFNN